MVPPEQPLRNLVQCCCGSAGCCGVSMTSAVYITWNFQLGGGGRYEQTVVHSPCPGNPYTESDSRTTGPVGIGRCSGTCRNCRPVNCVDDVPQDYEFIEEGWSGVNIPGLTLRCPIQSITYPISTFYWCAVVGGVRGDTSLQYYGQRQLDDFSPGTVYMNYLAPNNGADGGCCAIGFDWSTTIHPAADVTTSSAPSIRWWNRAKYYDYARAFRMARNNAVAARAVVAGGNFSILDMGNNVIYQWALAAYTLEGLRAAIDATPEYVCEANYGADAWTQNLPAAWFVDQDVVIPLNVGVPPARVDIEYGTPMPMGQPAEDFQPGAGAFWEVVGSGANDGYMVMPVQAVNGVVSAHPKWIGPVGIDAEACYCLGFGTQVINPQTPNQVSPIWWWTNTLTMPEGGVQGDYPTVGCHERTPGSCAIAVAAQSCQGGMGVYDWPAWGTYGSFLRCGSPESFTAGFGTENEDEVLGCDFCCTNEDCCCTLIKEKRTFSEYVSGSWQLVRTCNEPSNE